MSSYRRRLHPLVIIGTICASGSMAHAQGRAAAEAAFEQGRRLAAGGDYVAACAQFEASERLEPAVGTLLNLADCYEKRGRTASEWAALREASARASLANEGRRAATAKAKADALEPTLAKAKVVVSEPVDGLRIEWDGAPLGQALWGIAVPVDPGPHAIAARAPGSVPWSANIDVPPGPVLVIVGVPEPLPELPRASAAVASRALSSPRPLASPARRPDSAQAVALGLFSAGCGGLVSATIAGVGAIERKSAGAPDQARGWAEAFDWIVGPSTAAMVAGIIVHFVDGTSHARRTSVSVMPTWDHRGVGVVTALSF